MLKVLLVGNSPLPDENTKIRSAAGLRTYHFLEGLKELSDIEIKLVKIAMPEAYKDEVAYHESSDKFNSITIPKAFPGISKKLQKILNEYDPDVIIGVNTYPSYLVSRLKFKAPFWADLNGWIMVEAQAQAYKLGSNNYLGHYFEMEKSILRKADKFSAVSKAQKLAILGELAIFGRLNNETFGYEFVHHISNATEELKEETSPEKLYKEIEEKIPKNAFIVLWMGGYNTWVDEITLYKSLEMAMENCPKLYFLSTGGVIEGLDNKTFANFQKLINEGKVKDRFIFLGWIDTKQVPTVYEKADIGINVDRNCVETLTGARNRLNEMMKFGLPVVTTLGSEISYEIEKVKAGLTVESENVKQLADALKFLYEDWQNQGGRLREYSTNGKAYIKENCSYEITLEPLRNWLKSVGKAPDNGLNIDFGWFSKIKAALSYLRNNGFKKALSKLKT